MGESSPIVIGEQVFILTDGLRLTCLRTATGEPLWERTSHTPAGTEALSWEKVVGLHRASRLAQDRARRIERQMASVKANAERAKTPPDGNLLGTLQLAVPSTQAE